MWRKQTWSALALGAVVLGGCGGTMGTDRDAAGIRPAGSPPAGGYVAGMLPGSVPPGAKDTLFLVEAAHGSASEMELSRVALQRAKSQAVKDYAQMMLDQHRAASRELVDLAQREGRPLPGVPAAGVLQKTAAMRAAEADTFDRDFSQRMVDDHTQMLAMFRDVAGTGDDPEIRAWAARQVPILEGHLKQAQSLRDGLAKSAEKK
jgi:putative membrane protein